MTRPNQLDTVLGTSGRGRLIFEDSELQPGPIAGRFVICPALIMRLCEKLDAPDSIDGVTVQGLYGVLMVSSRGRVWQAGIEISLTGDLNQTLV